MQRASRSALLAALLALASVPPARGGEPLGIAPGRVSDISGEWTFRAGDAPEYARPDYDDSAWELRRVPYGWGPGRQTGSEIAWYRRELRLADPNAAQSRALGVTIGQVNSAYEIFAGGLRLGGVGALPPGSRAEYDRQRTYELPAQAVTADGRLVIALKVWRSPDSVPRVGAPVAGSFLVGPHVELVRREAVAELPELVLACLFAVGGLIHFLLFAGRRKSREYVLFGALSVLVGAYVFLRTQWKFELSDDFLLLKKAEHVVLYLVPAIFIELFHLLLGRPVGRLLRAIEAVTLAAGALLAVTPGLYWNLRALLPLQAVVALAMLVIATRLLSGVRAGHPEARTLSIGVLLLLLSQFCDIATDRGLVVLPRVTPFGFMAFFCAMALSLANRFSRLNREMERLQRELESRVEQRTRELVEANRAKSQFLANMSHEIRTPMNGVLGMARLLLEEQLTPRQREHAELIVHSGRNLLGVVNDVLDFSKIEAGRLELECIDFHVRSRLEGAVGPFASLGREKGVALRCEIDPGVPEALRGDPSRLVQAISNLIANAVKFTERGEVVVRVASAAAGPDRTRLDVEVRDTGIGIAPEAAARLFQPFVQAEDSTTRRFGGTGLGLVIARRLVQLMGGDIQLESRPGEGSRFRFSVELANSAGAAPERVQPIETLARGLRVLVADDSRINQKVVAGVLERMGFVTDVVGSGAEAIEAWGRSRYSAILMDCQMPGMDGYEATARIRQREDPRLHTPIVAMTASALIGDREKCLAAGMDDYLPKPFTPEDLARVMRRWTGTAGLDAGAAGEARPKGSGPLDPAVIEDLRALGPDFAREAFRMFLQTTPAKLEALSAAAGADDRTALRARAHGLRGSCAIIGARRMMELCAEVERRAEAPQADGLGQVVAAVHSEFSSVSAALEAEIASL
jgi:signal transduction histidine kinase/CheY-like chemotaxis protein